MTYLVFVSIRACVYIRVYLMDWDILLLVLSWACLGLSWNLARLLVAISSLGLVLSWTFILFYLSAIHVYIYRVRVKG